MRKVEKTGFINKCRSKARTIVLTAGNSTLHANNAVQKKPPFLCRKYFMPLMEEMIQDYCGHKSYPKKYGKWQHHWYPCAFPFSRQQKYVKIQLMLSIYLALTHGCG